MGICRLAWLDIEEGRLPVEDGLLSVDAINVTSKLEQVAACPRSHQTQHMQPDTFHKKSVTSNSLGTIGLHIIQVNTTNTLT